jgi:hypothetical protein
MDTIKATIVDARLARPNKLEIIVAKPRIHAQEQGSDHSLIWLIEPWQRREMELALCLAFPPKNEVIVISDGGTNYFATISRIISQFENILLPGSKLMVLSYSKKVIDFANQWRGSAVVGGARLIHYRSTIFRSLVTPSHNSGLCLTAENDPVIQKTVPPNLTMDDDKTLARINSFDDNALINDRLESDAEENRPGWERILTLLSQWVSPKANEIVSKVLERRVKFGESLSWGEMTQRGIVKQLEFELRADEQIGHHDASEKNTQQFFNRLMGASALLNQAGNCADMEDQSHTIASVDLQFRELLLEWVVLSIVRSDPVHFGNDNPSSIKRLEAVIDRLLIQRKIAEDSAAQLHSRWSPGQGDGEGTGSA